MVPSAFTRSLIDEKPAVIWGIPFGYPARRKIMVWVGRGRTLVRGRGTVEGTFACALIDADIQSAFHDEEKVKKRPSSLRASLKSGFSSKTHLRLFSSEEKEDDKNVLEVAIIWGVPLLDPTRW